MSKGRDELVTDLGRQMNALLVSSRALTAASANRFHPTLQPAAYQVAVTLSAHGTAKAGHLAELLDMDKSAISRLTKLLCENGLAEALADPNDGRATVYRLTAEGAKRLEEAKVVKTDAFLSRLTEWQDDDLIHFTELIVKFVSR